MGQILIIENDPHLAELYSYNLNKLQESTIIEMDDFLSAKDFINDQCSIKLIIAKDFMEHEKTAQELLDHLKKDNLQIPFIIIGQDHQIPSDELAVVESPVDIESLIALTKKILTIDQSLQIQLQLPQLRQIKATFFSLLTKSPCDVYLQSTPSNALIKVFSEKQEIQLNVLMDLRKRNINNLFILDQYFLEFSDSVTSQVLDELEMPNLTPVERLKTNEKTYFLVSDMIDKEGLSFNASKISTECIKSVQKVVQEVTSLKDLLEHLISAQNSYHYKHTQLLLYVASKIIGEMEWGNQEQIDKISFVIFFHDITLKSDEEVIAESIEDLESSSFTEEDQLRIATHALNAAQLIQSHERAPLGADVIIKQHHGSRTGRGFPHEPANDISPLAVVFIIAEEFTRLVLVKHKKNVTYQIIVKQIREKYKKDQYKKVVEVLKTINWEKK